jgi:hypothetical protein
LPSSKAKFQLEHHQLQQPDLELLQSNYHPGTVAQLMCRDRLSIDDRGNVYDCDFNQMADLPAIMPTGETLTVDRLLASR